MDLPAFQSPPSHGGISVFAVKPQTCLSRLTLIVLVIFSMCFEINAQCSAGTGLNGNSCSSCSAGYYCAAGSQNVFGGGAVSTLVGNGGGFSDGTGTAALFGSPSGISIDPSGSFALVADQATHRVRRISLPGGVVTTLAGSGSSTPFVDGTGTAATFNNPSGVSIDPSGSFALIVDHLNSRIRRISLPGGVVTTLAGSGTTALTDGTGIAAEFWFPFGVAIDPSGSFALVADRANSRIRRISLPGGVVTTLATSSSYGVSIDPSGSFALIAENNCVRRMSLPGGVITTLAGTGSYSPFAADGTGIAATFFNPAGMSIDPSGSFALVADIDNSRIRRISLPDGVVTTFAGNGSHVFVDGMGIAATLYNPYGVTIDPSGSFALVADTVNNRIRRLAFSAVCSAGSYCPTGSSSATQSACSAGFYCPAGSSSANQSICGAGYYCPAGSSSVLAQVICNPGYFCPAGSSSANQSVCGAGYYCPAGSSVANQSVCSAGYYCPAGSTSATQSVCGAGFYCPAGSSSVNQSICGAGYYCPAGSSSASQVLCNAGYFCPAGSSTFQICTSGSYCASGSSSNATMCPAGSYCSTPALISPCPGGYYCPTGTTSSVGAGQCDGGYYCPTGSSSSTQTICPIRNYCLPLAAFSGGSFMACQFGTYCNASGLSSGIQCDAGSYCASSLLTAPTGPCLAGYYCPAGSFFGTTNLCPAGSYCPAGSSVSTVCPAGTYCSASGLTAVSSAQPCTTGQICPAGSVSPSTSCPSGYSCVGNGVLPCTAGNYCPGGNAGSLPCPAGSICPVAQLGSPELCTGGYFCSSTGLTSVSGQCPIGKVCPVGSSAPAACPSGFMCTTFAMAVPSPCPSGRTCTNITSAVCPSGTYSFGNSTSCVSCPSGLYAGSPGSSSCFHCSLGSYSTNGVSCLACPSGSSCLFGAFQPSSSADLRRMADSIPVTSNPFQTELSDTAAVQAQQTALVLGGGSALVVLMLVLALSSQKFDCMGKCLNCRHNAAVTWVDLDIFFARSHWTPAESTLPAQHRKTSFGGMLSLILIVTVAIVSVQLGTSNLAPTYSTSISIETPQWQPHGDFSLSVTMFGSGLGVCRSGVASSDISVQWAVSDWSGSRPSTQFVFNEFDGSCVATWTCRKCKLISTSTTSLRVIVSSSAFSTHAQYVIKSPAFTTSATDPGVEYQTPFTVTGHVSSGDFSNLTAFQGGVSVVTTLLTLFNVTLGSQQRISYQPVVSNTLPGPVVTPENFDFSVSAGFEYRFDLTRNSFTIVNIGQTNNVFNLIVLLLSLAGSIISGFTLLLPQLEKHMKIVTVWGAPVMKGDVVRNWSDKISELEVRLLLKSKQVEMIEERLNDMDSNDAFQPGRSNEAHIGEQTHASALRGADKLRLNRLEKMFFAKFPDVMLTEDSASSPQLCSATIDSDDVPTSSNGVSIELTSIPTLVRREVNTAPAFASTSDYAQIPSPTQSALNPVLKQSETPMHGSSPVNVTSFDSELVQRPVASPDQGSTAQPVVDRSHSVQVQPTPHVSVELSIPTKLPPPPPSRRVPPPPPPVKNKNGM